MYKHKQEENQLKNFKACFVIRFDFQVCDDSA